MNSNPLPAPPSNLTDHLIIASPVLTSSIFEKACIYISDYDKKAGYEGFILNHQTDQYVKDVYNKLSGKPLGELPVYFGGPVESDSLHFIILQSTDGDNLTCQSHVNVARANYALDEPNTIVLPCLGYSGWTVGQLENEFEHHTWFFDKPTSNLTKRKLNRGLWKKLLSEISPYHQLIANAPTNPLTN